MDITAPKAQALKEDTLQRVKSGSQEASDKARAESDKQMAEAAADAQKEIQALKELIVPKKKEAVEKVIAALV